MTSHESMTVVPRMTASFPRLVDLTISFSLFHFALLAVFVFVYLCETPKDVLWYLFTIFKWAPSVVDTCTEFSERGELALCVSSDVCMTTPDLVLGHFVSKIQLRFLQSTDVAELKTLCKDWFPIDYPDVWYNDVTSNAKFFALAATLQNKIVGVIVAEIKSRHRSNKEDANILGFWYPVDTKVAYILILGVAEPFRRKGVASLLLDTFLSQVNSVAYASCKAVYLHVLASNTAALRFYTERNFKPHLYLPLYYSIDGVKVDGYSYVLYVNGGEPPWTIMYPFLPPAMPSVLIK